MFIQSNDIQRALEELQQKQFFDAGQAKFAEVMRWKDRNTLESWADNLLRTLVPYVKGLQAVLYYADQTRHVLQLAASYGVNFDDLKQQVIYGDGLVGQAARSHEIIHLEGLDESYFSACVSSAFIKPESLLILPLEYNQKVWGVIEIFFMHTLHRDYLEFLKRISTEIGANLNALIKDKELQESEERFKKLAEVTLEGITFTSQGVISETNSVFLDMFGYTSWEVIGKPLTYFALPEYYDQIHEKVDTYYNKPYEIIGICKDGIIFPVEVQSRNITYNGEPLTVTTFRDITERKKAEEELRQSEAQLAEAQKIVALLEIIETKNKNITASINYARKIQQSILPDMKLINERLPECFIFYQCRDVVSGDFYWFSDKGDQLLIAAVDCTGHGVPGAFMSLIGYSQLNRIVNELEVTAPDQVLSMLDESVVRSLKQREDSSSREGMDVALCKVDMVTNKLHFAGANRPLCLIRNGELEVIKGNPFPVGDYFYHRHQQKAFTSHEIDLLPGDLVYIFSDGYADQFSADGKKYTSKRLRRFLLGIHQEDIGEQHRLLKEEFENWKGASQQIDDILLIGMRF